MSNGQQAAAQAFYLAQLQACKGKCECNVCKLLRKAADQQAEAILASKDGPALSTDQMISLLGDQGYSVIRPDIQEEERV